MNRVQVPVPLPAGRVGERRRTRKGARLLEEQLRRADDLRVLREEVDAASGAELQALALVLDCLVSQRSPTSETEDRLVVAAERDGLQRVRAQVGEGRLRKDTALGLNVEEAGDVRDGVGDAGAVVVVVRKPLVRLIPGPRRVHAEVQFVRKALLHVGSNVLAIVEGVVDDAAVVGVARGQKVRRILVAAAHIDVCAVGEWLVAGDLLQVVIVGDRTTHRIRPDGGRVVGKEPRYRVGPERPMIHHHWRAWGEDARRRPTLQLEKAQALRDGGPRLAGLTAFGLDDDDAIRGFRPVDRRRGGAAQYLDRLDVVGVHIGEAVDRIVLQFSVPAIGGTAGHREQAGGQRRVAVDHAIHHEERIGIADHRVVAAQLDLRATARGPRVLADDRSGNPPRQRPVHGRRRNTRNLLPGDIRGRDRRVAPLHARRLARDHHRLEVEHIGLERHVGRVLTPRDRDLAPLKRDAAEHQRRGARRRRNRVATVGVGDGRERGAGHGDVDAGDRLAVRGRGHAAADLALLAGCAGRAQRHER